MAESGQVLLATLVALGVGAVVLRGRAKKRREKRIKSLGVQEGVDAVAARSLREADRLMDDYRAELTRERFNERRLTSLDVKINTLLGKAEAADDLWSPPMRHQAMLAAKVWDELKHQALAMRGAELAEKGQGSKGERAESFMLKRVPSPGDLVLISEAMNESGASYRETLKRAYKLAAENPELETAKVDGVWILKRKRT